MIEIKIKIDNIAEIATPAVKDRKIADAKAGKICLSDSRAVPVGIFIDANSKGFMLKAGRLLFKWAIFSKS